MENRENIKTKAKKINIRMILVLIFLLFYGIFTYCNIRGEYLYNLELGQQYVEKFMQSLQYNSIIFVSNFVFLFLFFYVLTVFIKKGLRKFFVEEKKVMPKLPNKSLALVLSAIVTIIIVPKISSNLILAMNAASFEMTDKVFNMDISYYVFQRPAIEMMLQYVIFIGVISLIYVAIYYIISLNVYFNGIELESLKKNTVIKLLIFLAMAIVVSISFITYIKAEDILFSNFLNLDSGINLVGAGSTDIFLKIWGFRILSAIIILSAILIINYMLKGQKQKLIKAVLIVPAYLICLLILILGYQYIFVNSNKLDKEYDYIKYNIENTKIAYNIKIEENELNYSGTVNYDEVQKNKYALSNIPVIDENITLTTLKEYQSKQGIYGFNNTKLLKYNNELVYLTPREIMNSTYEYTHGFGAIITSATKVDENNQINYLQSGFESDVEKDFVNIEEPRIYFGTSTNNVILTDLADKNEFDYPVTSTEVANNVYDGKAGVKLGFFDRLILSIKEKNMSILFTSGLNDSSKILLNRNILERAKKVLPEIIYDENPYLVISDEGKLVWVIDGYTVSNQYPYSNMTTITVNGVKQDINYIRNSVKVLVDAYDGTIEYYITDRNDPIIMAYWNLYPTIFKDLDENLPEDISRYITYPEFLYNIQSQMLNIYHNIQPEVLYRNDDIWEIATYQFSQTTSKAAQMSPNYTIISDQNKLALVIPYTLKGKQSLNSYLTGVYDEESGENVLVLNKFISNNGILGPKQLERQIEEDAEISKEIEKISLAGTKLIKNLYVVPIENTIIYVEPIYQVLVNESPVPILKKVIVSSGNKLAIGDKLEEALQNLLSQYAVNIEIESSDDIDAVIESIIKANNNLTSSSESNNWSLMGQDIQKLQELVKKLETLKAEEVEKEQEMEKAQPTGSSNVLSNQTTSNAESRIDEKLSL